MALKNPSRRAAASFDKRSVLLFAALSLGGAAALQAQPARPGTAAGAATRAATAAGAAGVPTAHQAALAGAAPTDRATAAPTTRLRA